MKTVILAGGFGTRISEESQFKPKPMVEIGGQPILWHIMKEYSYYGYNDFIICVGYKQQVIKEWFRNYFLYNSDITFDFSKQYKMIVHDKHAEPWRVTVVDTGLNTMTGGRLKRIQKFIGNERFFFTYGDGVCDVNINDVLAYHKKMGKIATTTSVKLAQNKGIMDITDGLVTSFREKSDNDSSRINGGYMVLEPEVFNYIEGDNTTFEREPMNKLAEEGQLAAYLYDGFWQCMDTKREKDELEDLISSGKAPWIKW